MGVSRATTSVLMIIVCLVLIKTFIYINISRVAEPEPKHFFVRSEPGAEAKPMTPAPTENDAYKNLRG